MTIHWKEENVDQFRIHDAETRQMHMAYLELVLMKPTKNQAKLKKEAERKAKEQASDLTAALTITTTENEAKGGDEALSNDSLALEVGDIAIPESMPLKAVDERETIRQAQKQTLIKRIMFQIFAFIAGLMLASGGALLLGPVLVKFLPFPAPSWLLGTVIAFCLALLTALFGSHVSRLYQISREQKAVNRGQTPDFREVAEIALIEPVLKFERSLGEPEMTQELKKFALLRWNNKRHDDVMGELKTHGIGLLSVVTVLLTGNVMHFRTMEDGMFVGFFVTFLGGLGLAMLIQPLASNSLDIPNLPDFSVFDPEDARRKHEADRKRQHELLMAREATRKEELQSQERARTEQQQAEEKMLQQKVEAEIELKAQQIFEAETNRFDADSQDFRVREEKLYQDLRVATMRWEELRGFTPDEIHHMSGLRKNLNGYVKWLFYPASLISAALATYPASIYTAELMESSYMYTTIGKFAPPAWGIWIVLMIVAEILLVLSSIKLRQLKYCNDVLLKNYDTALRRKGMTYSVLRKADVKRERLGPNLVFGGGILILLIELCANILYLNSYGMDNSAMTWVISFVPFSLLVGFAFILSEMKYQLSYLNDSLGYGEPTKPPAARQQLSSYKEINSESKRLAVELENEVGPRPISGKRRRKSE